MSRPEKREGHMCHVLKSCRCEVCSDAKTANRMHDLFTQHIEDSKPSLAELILIIGDHNSGNAKEGQEIAEAIYKRLEDI